MHDQTEAIVRHTTGGDGRRGATDPGNWHRLRAMGVKHDVADFFHPFPRVKLNGVDVLNLMDDPLRCW
jgi:hypothetical protein